MREAHGEDLFFVYFLSNTICNRRYTEHHLRQIDGDRFNRACYPGAARTAALMREYFFSIFKNFALKYYFRMVGSNQKVKGYRPSGAFTQH